MERNERCFHGGWNDIHPSYIFTYEETSQTKMAKDSFCKEGLKLATMKAGLGKNNKKLSTAPQSEVHIPSDTNEASTECHFMGNKYCVCLGENGNRLLEIFCVSRITLTWNPIFPTLSIFNFYFIINISPMKLSSLGLPCA